MDEHIGERVSALETEVAVIQATCVRRDAFVELNATVDRNFAFSNEKIDSKFTLLDEKIDRKIEQATARILRWTFGMQFTFAALIIAVIKYL